MYDSGKVITGIIVFLIIITFPVWYNVARGKANYVPELEYPVDTGRCVADSAYIRAYHMDLLNTWRDQVVREGIRVYRAADGRTFEMSLSNTCMNCHQSKENFCDKCHDYLSVSPYCWDCHIDPKELKR
ncbi:MAG: sulfate reduction electron transfer complex DsrMKJOP subunit DsrJ [candidate division Zixibacteria bacterium]|nr:sulfate reduction electron transfer complex DsrMKJOP subunit DsrJ [candidate division Zixibacteria bacterium]